MRTTRFDIGYRAWPENAHFEESRYGYLWLVIEMSHWFGENTREFYRVADDHVEMLRREQLDGSYLDNFGFEAGSPTPLRADAPQWKGLLTSNNPGDQLRGLIACAHHQRNTYVPILKEDTQRRVEQLAQSDDLWVSDQATFLLELAAERERQQL